MKEGMIGCMPTQFSRIRRGLGVGRDTSHVYNACISISCNTSVDISKWQSFMLTLVCNIHTLSKMINIRRHSKNAHD